MWPELPKGLTHVDAVYERPDGKIAFFIGKDIVQYIYYVVNYWLFWWVCQLFVSFQAKSCTYSIPDI